MNSQELESRTTAAEKDSTLIRKLIADFKADKDQQLSDLTQLVNAAQGERDIAIATKDKAVADVQKSFDAYKVTVQSGIAAIKAAAPDHEVVNAIIDEYSKSDNQKALDALNADIAAKQAQADELTEKLAENKEKA